MSTSENIPTKRIPISQALLDVNPKLRSAELTRVSAQARSGSDAIAQLMGDAPSQVDLTGGLQDGRVFLGVVFGDGHRFLRGFHPEDLYVVSYNPGEIYLLTAPTFGMTGQITQEQLEEIANSFLNRSGPMMDIMDELRESGATPPSLDLNELLRDYQGLSDPYLKAARSARVPLKGQTNQLIRPPLPAFYQGKWVA